MATMQVQTIATLLLLLLVGIASSSSGVSTVAVTQSGGMYAYPGQFPWQVALIKKTKDFLGSGALISNNFVLTAASVVSNEELIDAFLGAQTLYKNGYYVSVKKSLLHDGWQEEGTGNDLALLKLSLSTDFLFTDNVWPVRLPPRLFQGTTFVGQTLTISSWGGSYSETEESRQNYMVISNQDVIRNKECQSLWRQSTTDLPWTTMCTVDSGEGELCQVDKGSPAVFMEEDGGYTLIGIVSSDVQGNSARPSLLARTTEHLDWIDSNSDVTVQ